MRRLAAFVIVLGLGLGLPALAGAGSRQQTYPNCSKFSTRKVSRLVGVGRLHLDHTLPDGTACTYYGVNAAQANKLAMTMVPYTQITYYPSLMISDVYAPKVKFDLLLQLFKRTASNEGLDFGRVAKPLRFTSDEYFYSGVVTGSDQPKCDPQIMYDNWVGPPECDGEPGLRKVGVIARDSVDGQALMIGASQQAPPGNLSLSHILELARETAGGQLY
jgi:hypothetical protein